MDGALPDSALRTTQISPLRFDRDDRVEGGDAVSRGGLHVAGGELALALPSSQNRAFSGVAARRKRSPESGE